MKISFRKKTLSLLQNTLLGLALAWAPISQSQTLIQLSLSEQARQGVLTRQVKVVDNSTGVEVAAEVITSPLAASQLIALYDGVVVRWLLNAGEPVQKGMGLVEIRSQEILALQREWKQALTSKEQAQFDLDKDRQLYESGVISAGRLAATERDFSNAEFTLSSIVQSLTSAGLSTSGLMQEHGLYVINAPADGSLSHRVKEAGEAVQAGSQVGEIATAGAQWLQASIPAQYARGLELGQSLRLAQSDINVILRQKDQALDSATQTIDIHAEFSRTSDYFPGEILKLTLPSVTQGVWVPSGAVVHNGNETTVYISTAEGFEARSLELIPSGSGYVASSGLQAGDEIVVQGTAILKGIELGLGGGE